MDLAGRRARYSKVSAALADLGDDALRGLLAEPTGTPWWGTTQSVEVAGERVFVKSVPLTDLERARASSTRNHYRLPMAYQYGVGSAGFGAWREVATHLATTDWVLRDAFGAFPLAYHVRVVERSRQADPPGGAEFEDYIRYWNSSRNLARFLTERSTGRYAVLIFLEHLPYTIWEWLLERPDDIDRMVGQLYDTVSFLRGHGVVHFDAHFNNVVTDGEQVYLTDFGLTLASAFDLSDRERAFLERHGHYDYGGIAATVGAQLMWWHHSLPEAEQESVRALVGAVDDGRVLVRGVERLGGLVPPALAEAVVRYREVFEYMVGFFERLRANRRKDTPYDDGKLRELLLAAGVQPRAESHRGSPAAAWYTSSSAIRE